MVGNSALDGGGLCGSGAGASTSIIYHNTALTDPNFSTNVYLVHCCSTPIPYPSSSFTNDPAFVNIAAGNFRLSSNSPCINFSNYSFPPDPEYVDLDGNPRAVGGSIDLGAYEFQNPTSVISYLWLQQHGLPTNGSADYADHDGDLFNNYSEWRASTDPFEGTSLLKIRNFSVVTNSNLALLTHLEWQAVPGIYYFVEGSTNATGPFSIYADYIWADSTNMIWENPINPPDLSTFYKVGVK